MNWTGGRLQHHSTGNRDVAAKQKQHFAKIQQNLRGGVKKKSPIKWSIFNHVVEHREHARRELSGVEPILYHRERKDSVRSAGSSLQPIPSLPSRRETSLAPKINNPQLTPLVPAQHGRSPADDDDLYDATPPRIFKQEAPVALPDIDGLAELDEAMSEKRRRLLRMGDWVGLNIQKSIGVKFITSAVEENVGKRKKLTDGHRARYQSKQSHITSPFANKRRRLLSPSREEYHPLEQKTDVRIIIGGKVVPPGISSSSVLGRDGSRPGAERRMSFTDSSDVMLLDGGTRPRLYASKIDDQATPDSPVLPTELRQSSILDNTICTDNAQMVKSCNGMLTQIKDNSKKQAENSDLFIQKSLRKSRILSRHQRTKASLYDHPGVFESLPTHRSAIKIPQTPENGTDSPNTKTRQEELLQRFGSSICETYLNEEGETVFSSRPSSIHHPAPQSSRKSSLLPSDSSQKGSSTLCRIGELKPIVPRSQISENEIWATWIAPISEGDEIQEPCSERESSGIILNRIISPGISTIFNARKVSKTSFDDGQSSPLEDPDSEEYSQHAFAGLSGQYTRQHRDENSHDPLLISSKKLRSPAKPGTPLRRCRSTKAAIVTEAVEEEPQEQIDEKWRKFVFGDSSDNVEDQSLGSTMCEPSVRTTGSLENLSPLACLGTDISVASPRVSTGSRIAYKLPAGPNHQTALSTLIAFQELATQYH